MPNASEIVQINARLERVFQSVFRLPNLKIHPGMTRDDIRAWDSLTHVELIVTVEKEFGVRFRLEEIKSLKSVGAILEALQMKL